jgi:phospho-N-acetylmuramoyl-pentapeptide-transferase
MDFSVLNVFRYITFRTILSTLASLTFLFLFGHWVIGKLRAMQVGQFIREDGPPNHLNKEGTPTMGGCLIIPVIIVSTLLWAELSNIYVWLVLFVLFCFGLIGFFDDYLKVVRRDSRGLSKKAKFSLQVLVALVVAVSLELYPGFDSRLNLPFFKTVTPDLGLWYIPVAIFIIVGASNAVNLTDGLDGLAIGPILVAFTSYLVFSYLAGHVKIASYLQIPYVAGSGELSVLCGAVVGAGPIGAVLGTVAVITKQEVVLILVGGIFVVETLSVIFQVVYFKLTGGQRIFRMAPLHHHFELKGWPETKVTVRFWIIAIILALFSLSTFKLR